MSFFFEFGAPTPLFSIYRGPFSPHVRILSFFSLSSFFSNSERRPPFSPYIGGHFPHMSEFRPFFRCLRFFRRIRSADPPFLHISGAAFPTCPNFVPFFVVFLVISREQLALGCQRAIDASADLALDNPKAPLIVAAFVEEALADGHLDPTDGWQEAAHALREQKYTGDACEA